MPSLPTSNREIEQYRHITMLLDAKLSILFDLAASAAAEAAEAKAEAEASAAAEEAAEAKAEAAAKAGVDVGAGGAAQVQGDRGVPQHCGA